MRAQGGFAESAGRWGWVLLCVLGALGLMAGGWYFIQAHPTVPTQITGRIADYERITSSGAYLRNELHLTGDNHIYQLDATQFQPALPAQLYENGKTTLWIDQGTTTIVAITLYDQNDANPTVSTTVAYRHPTLAMRGMQQNAEIISAASIALLLGALAWAILLLRRMRREQPVPVMAGRVRVARPGGWR